MKTVATAGSALIEARSGQGTGAFLMPPDEAADIAAPASRLLARHAPMPGGAGKVSDLSDAVELVVAVVGYLVNGLARRVAAFAAHQAATPGLDRGENKPDANYPPADPPPAAMPAWPSIARPPTVGLG